MPFFVLRQTPLLRVKHILFLEHNYALVPFSPQTRHAVRLHGAVDVWCASAQMHTNMYICIYISTYYDNVKHVLPRTRCTISKIMKTYNSRAGHPCRSRGMPQRCRRAEMGMPSAGPPVQRPHRGDTLPPGGNRRCDPSARRVVLL